MCKQHECMKGPSLGKNFWGTSSIKDSGYMD